MCSSPLSFIQLLLLIAAAFHNSWRVEGFSLSNKVTSNASPNNGRRRTTYLSMSSIDYDQLDRIPPRKLVQLGMQYFKQGDVKGSIEIFDRAEKMEPSIRPYLWQRGISYYYADRFQDGSDQFRYDVKVNPLDVEEIVWDIACQYMGNQNRDDLLNKMSLPKGKTDRRKIMVRLQSPNLFGFQLGFSY